MTDVLAGCFGVLGRGVCALTAVLLLARCGPVPGPAANVGATTTPGATGAAAVTDADAAPALATPIADRYRDAASAIIAAATRDREAYTKLAYLTDRIGHRLSGSAALEQAIVWAVDEMVADGHEDVHAEPVMVPHWVRGAEQAEIVAPTAHTLQILGLGGTIGTSRAGVTAEVVVIRSFEELGARAAEVRGKIVLYDVAMPAFDDEQGSGYGDVVRFRVGGPSAAAKAGAVAVLMRSVTAHSLRSPHTGTLVYDPAAPRIPAAAVSTEDADLIARITASGTPVTVRLQLGARFLPDAESHNVIGELRGRETPEEIVLIGAHIDSWDVGQGAHDDGAGCVIVMQALTVLRRLGLRPRRTIRVVLFTNEENGLRGARAYAVDHAAEVPRHIMALESDSGGFRPRGVQVQGSETAVAQMRDIITLLGPVEATESGPGFGGADITPLTRAGVQGLGLWVDGSRYFDYHHTHADTLDKVDPVHLARNVAVVATVAYVIADMPARFGGDDLPTPTLTPAAAATPAFPIGVRNSDNDAANGAGKGGADAARGPGEAKDAGRDR